MSRSIIILLVLCLFSQKAKSQSIGQVAKFVDAAERDERDELGRSVTISGDWAAAGAWFDFDDGVGGSVSYAGSVLIFKRASDGTWAQAQKIVAGDRSTNGGFGFSVSMDGGLLVIGATDEDFDNGIEIIDSGAAYIFELDEVNGTWTEVQKIGPSDAQDGDQFGYSVSIDGNHIIVGAPFENHDAEGNNSLDRAGSAYIFEYDASSNNWMEANKIVASDRDSDDRFGHSVAISGDLALSGAWGFDSSTGVLTDSGAAFAFKKNPTTGEWVEIQLITPNLEGTRAEFGYSLSMDGTTGLIGAYSERRDASGGNSLTSAGAAYIFNYDAVGELWSEDQKLVSSDREAGDRFGISVDLSDGTAVVGATLQDYDADGNNFLNAAGSAYFFERSSGVWSEVNKLITNDRAESDLVGSAVAISGQKAILGVQNESEDVAGNNTLDRAGSIYIFEPTNFAPVVANPIEDQELLPGFTTFDIELSLVFNDPENDDLTYSVSSNDPDIATVSMNTSTLSIAWGGDNGQATITVVADDGNDGQAEDVFLVTVNSPVTLQNPVGFQLQQVGFGTLIIDLNAVFSDADMDVLSYNASIDDENVATVSISTNTLVITEVAAGSATIDISAEDAFSSANDQFTLQINTPPSGSINDLLYQEGFTSVDITLTDFITDADGDGLQFTPSSGNTDVVMVSESNDILTITEVGFGTATITVGVNDDNGGLVDVVFDIRVNRAPVVINPLPDLILQQDFESRQVDLSNVFTDDDGDDLTLDAQSSNNSEISEEIVGATLFLGQMAMPLESPGDLTITVTASDGFDGGAMDEFNITINNPPVYDQPLDDLTLQLGFETHDIDISSVFQDNTIDVDGLTVSASSADETIATVDVSDNQLIITEIGTGTTNITLTADDNQGGTTDGSFELVVNNPPTLASPIDDLEFLAGFAAENISLSGVFVDLDEDELSYTLTSDNQSVVTVSANNGLLAITEVGTGSATITIIATDGNGGQISEEFLITVQEVSNTAPSIITEIVDQVFDFGFENSTIDISEVFTDADGDDLTITVGSSDESVITASFMEGKINITQVGVGDALVTVTANDGEGGEAVISFRVTVHNVVTGIDLEEKFQLSLYPNPTQDYLSIDLPKNDDQYSFRIFSLSGTEFPVITRQEIFQQSITLDVSTLPSGIYFLNLSVREKTWNERFIKQ